jgi:hypothetical protein
VVIHTPGQGFERQGWNMVENALFSLVDPGNNTILIVFPAILVLQTTIPETSTFSIKNFIKHQTFP